MEKVKIDKQWTLKLWDFLKGAYVVGVAPAVLFIIEQFQVGNFNLDWKTLGYSVGLTLIGYLVKNLSAPTKVVIEQPTELTIKSVSRSANMRKFGDR